MKKIKNDLSLAGFNVAVSWNEGTTVHKGWVKVEELLKDIGLAAMGNQKLSIKIEVDTRPPKGAVCNKILINRYVLFSVQHHDLASLMAGKIHALVTRKYAKGRDWYDLLWYLGHRPPTEPNITLLQNALDQTQGQGVFKAVDWKQDLMEIVKGLDCNKLVDDVQPFLERPEDSGFLQRDNLISILSSKDIY